MSTTPIILRVSTLAFVALLGLQSCRTVQDHRNDLHSTRERELTAGIVRREIKKGMGVAEVAQALGSPNITRTEDDGREVWVYDKIATEASYSEGQSAIFLILGGVSNQSGAMATTQRTLTVIITFDKDGKVTTFNYHQSKF
jgi:outer membrane protein assembly factor BamE (lipoprotein component of BamABCDE complex)